MKIIIRERIYNYFNYKYIFNIRTDVNKYIDLFTFTNDMDILFLKDYEIESKLNISGNYFVLKDKELEINSMSKEITVYYIVEKTMASKHEKVLNVNLY